MSTTFWQYNALDSVKSLVFKDLILKAERSDDPKGNWNIPDELRSRLQDNNNRSQFEAINVSF